MSLRDIQNATVTPAAPFVMNGMDGDRVMMRVAPVGGIATLEWANSTAGPWYAFLDENDAAITVADAGLFQNRLEAAPFMRVTVDAGTAEVEAYLQGGQRQ